MNWFHDTDGLWRLRDSQNEHRAGIHLVDGHWRWTAFSKPYDHVKSQVIHGSSTDLEIAKRDAVLAVQKLDNGDVE